MNTSPKICDCGHPPTPQVPGNAGTGYGTQRDGATACYECCAVNDRADMIESGKATLYLVDSQASIGRAWSVQNWPGSLSFAVHSTKHSKRGGGFGSQRTDAYFTGPDGKAWHAVNRGDMQIARCHRLAKQPRSK